MPDISQQIHIIKRAIKNVVICVCFIMCIIPVSQSSGQPNKKIKVIIDTDANNEVDDQFALGYLFFSGDYFEVAGVTVNATPGGGDIDKHYAEAERILKLCSLQHEISLKKGANKKFEKIKDDIDRDQFDGQEAVDFIIQKAHEQLDEKLLVLAVGKLTNIALAIKKDPSIASKIHVYWLGSNYPRATGTKRDGEYNLMHDTGAVNYVLNSAVPFDIIPARYNEPSGTHAVRVTLAEVQRRMPGKGPQLNEPVEGRNGREYYNFGDYATSLFENYRQIGDPLSRPLFDVVVVSILKNSTWAEFKKVPAPLYRNEKWVERNENPRKITIWENFDIYGIVYDFFTTMDSPKLVNQSI